MRIFKVQHQVALGTLMALMTTACQPDSVNSGSAPETTGDWLTNEQVAYGMRMDVETYSYRVVKDYGKNPSKLMTDIQASPHLYRQRLESRVLQDGSLELIKTQLQPVHLNQLPPQQRTWQELGPHQIVVKNNVSTFYDAKGRQIGQRQLKPTNFSAQLEQMREVKRMASSTAREGNNKETTGYPVIDMNLIRSIIRENPDKVKQLGKDFVEVRQDVSTEQGTQYALSRFDTKWGRLMRSEVYDAKTQRLLQRKVCRYNAKGGRFFLIGTLSETYLIDEKTGITSTEYTYEYLQDVQFVNNI